MAAVCVPPDGPQSSWSCKHFDSDEAGCIDLFVFMQATNRFQDRKRHWWICSFRRPSLTPNTSVKTPCSNTSLHGLQDASFVGALMPGEDEVHLGEFGQRKLDAHRFSPAEIGIK
jgi:hypothetical protein